MKTDGENGKRVFDGLGEFGIPLGDLRSAEFAQQPSFFRIGGEPVAVDILTKLASGRPQDIADVAAIRKAIKSRRREQEQGPR